MTQQPPSTPATCADLDRLRIADPQIVDDSGDGIVSPGEGITIDVAIEDISGYGFNDYPYVAWSATGASFEASQVFFAVLQCGAMPTSDHALMSATLTPGQTVIVTARVAGLSLDCPAAPSLAIPIVIGPK